MNNTGDYEALPQIRDYDTCFAAFLKPPGNGQKIMQAILLREAFSRFVQHGTGIRRDAPTTILDVSCGPGDYSLAWTCDIARFFAERHGVLLYRLSRRCVSSDWRTIHDGYGQENRRGGTKRTAAFEPARRRDRRRSLFRSGPANAVRQVR